MSGFLQLTFKYKYVFFPLRCTVPSVCVSCRTLSSPAGWCVNIRDSPVSTTVSGAAVLYLHPRHSLPRPQLP